MTLTEPSRSGSDEDVRAPLSIAEDLHAAIPASELVVLPGVDHVSSVEAGGLFNAEVRRFLGSCRSDPSWSPSIS